MPERRILESSVLVDRLRREVQERRGSYSSIGRQTGIPESWLRAFAQGRVGDPGFGRMECQAAGLGYRVKITGRPRQTAGRNQAGLDEQMAITIKQQVYGGGA